MTNPLYRNDKIAAFPDSWYATTFEHPPLRDSLRGEQTADVCIIGAGYTGLSAARTLASAGMSVIVLDAHRAGFGASGRNGGQVASGYNWPQRMLAKKLGDDPARALWDLTQEAKADVAAFADIDHLPGIAHGCYSAKELDSHRRDAAFLTDNYNYSDVTVLETTEFANLVRSPGYRGGVVDHGGAHIHPLRYALALADAAQNAGAVIYEKSPVHHIAKGTKVTIRADKGHVTADHLILATNGYIGGLEREVAAKVLPLNSFICATAPLDETILRDPVAVEDARSDVNYYRMTPDNRLLFGGRASAKVAFPRDIGGLLRPRFEGLFPQIKGVAIDYAWGGTLGMTLSGLPAVQRIAPNIVSAAGFSGHGVALSGLCGKVMAEAVMGQAGRMDILAALPTPNMPGGPMFGRGIFGALIALAGLRERLRG